MFGEHFVDGFGVFEVAGFAYVFEAGFGDFAGGDGAGFDFVELGSQGLDCLLVADEVGVVTGGEGAHGAEFDFFHGYLAFEAGCCAYAELGLGVDVDDAGFFLELFEGDFGVAEVLFGLEELFFVEEAAV